MNAVHTSSSRTHKAYPNAANHRYYLDKLADSILSAAICIGVVTIVFFLITFV